MAPDGEAPKGAGGAGQGAPPGAREGSQDLRQALVQEAVAFMAHPRVRDAGAGIKRMLLLGEGLTVPEVDEAFDRIRAFGAALIPPKPLGAAAVRSHVSETASAIAASAQLHGGRPHLSAPQPRDAGAHREDDGWAQVRAAWPLARRFRKCATHGGAGLPRRGPTSECGIPGRRLLFPFCRRCVCLSRDSLGSARGRLPVGDACQSGMPDLGCSEGLSTGRPGSGRAVC
ncbi:unnamed protein product [Ostreobium quekettii]|uniref:Uncharacterized protein n=1 Tax=Ostreobium quekettii TaxID=121088 RepID=A0A8S1JCW0_9CHLO|nr:unnamed protein product [Ostreobium quekettii]